MVRPTLHPFLSIKSNLKFLCSYGGKIVPRYPDGKLRYHGGHTRVLAVPSSISFSELMLKMGAFCGEAVTLRCQLPTEDLDALITIKSDEDLSNLVEEYGRIASTSSIKVRAFLSPVRSPSTTTTTSSLSPPSSPKTLSPSSSFSAAGSSPRSSHVMAYPAIGYAKSANRNCHHCCRNSSHVYLIHNGNHWQ